MLTYLRFLSGTERSTEANRHLGLSLAFVAGAVNAGGFLAVAQYTSHVTGVLSAVSDNLVLGHSDLVVSGLCSLAAFVAGAATCALVVNWARRKGLRSRYALALMLEGALLLIFGVIGARLRFHGRVVLPGTVSLLCYIMGLQNAIITKVSSAEIRTTHMTGNATDLGIELGRLAYRNKAGQGPDLVVADRDRMKLLASLIGLFIAGGVVGAFGFKHAGYFATLPLAAFLFLIAAVPVWDDVLAK